MPGKRQVAILEVHPIGNYAVRLVFDEFERDLEHKGALLRHVHVQNLDQQHDRVAERVAMLKELGHALTWSIEFTTPLMQKGDAEACFAQSVEDMEFLRSCLG